MNYLNGPRNKEELTEDEKLQILEAYETELAVLEGFEDLDFDTDE